MKNKNFPFEQVFVMGGTGQTGHRLLQILVQQPGLVLVATSRLVTETPQALLPFGPLAHTIQNDAEKWGRQVSWAALDFEKESIQGDLEKLEGLLKKGKRTCCIIAGAYTNVEGCEVDPAKSERVNETHTREVLEWAKEKFDAKLVFYSTDYVFDGKEGPYNEDHPRHSICKYGHSKVYIEEWLEKNAPATGAQGALILRTTGVYDYLPGSKNFLMQMLDLWGQGKTTRIPSDQSNNPVWARDLARATFELLCLEEKGIFNVGGGQQLYRVDYARLIARIFGFSENLIEPVTTMALGQKAPRPLKAGLRCDKLSQVLGWAPSTPEEVLTGFKHGTFQRHGNRT